jgi:hypothetical protein
MSVKGLLGKLGHGRLRERLNGGLFWGCVAAGASLIAAILMMVAARYWPQHSADIVRWIWLPVLAIVLAAVIGTWLTRPPITVIAFLLDRRAGLEEHLSTWLECLNKNEASAHPVRKAFIKAQRRATLARAMGLNPARHLPLRPPSWSPVLWLGLLLLGCALLMPEREAESVNGDRSAFGRAGMGIRATGGGAPKRFSSGAPKKRITPFTPTDRYRGRIVALDDRLSKEEKAAMLRELESKLGSLSESDLPDEDRALLAELREQIGGKKTAKEPKGGTMSTRASQNEEPASAEPRHVGAASAGRSPVELVAIARDRFPDEADALARYYGLGQNGPEEKSSGRRENDSRGRKP